MGAVMLCKLMSVDAHSGKVFSSSGRYLKSTIPAKLISKDKAIKIAKSVLFQQTTIRDQDIVQTEGTLDQWPDNKGIIKTRWTIEFSFKVNKNEYGPHKAKIVINSEDGTLLLPISMG